MFRSAFTLGPSYSQWGVIHLSKGQSVRRRENGINYLLLFTDYFLDSMPKFLMGKTGKMNPKQKVDVREDVCGPALCYQWLVSMEMCLPVPKVAALLVTKCDRCFYFPLLKLCLTLGFRILLLWPVQK